MSQSDFKDYSWVLLRKSGRVRHVLEAWIEDQICQLVPLSEDVEKQHTLQHSNIEGSYFISIQDEQIREHIAKIAVDYGILEFRSSSNLEDIYLRILQKSSLSQDTEENASPNAPPSK